MFSYILYRIGQFVALAFPLKVVYAVAVFVSDLHYLFADKDRAAVTENLKAIFPDKSEEEIRGIRIKIFRNFAKYLADFFRFSKIDAEYVKNNVKVENTRYLDEALAKGTGAIILSAHIGNWEWGGIVTALSGYPFYAVALPHKHKRVDDFFNSQREAKGMHVIPLGKAVRQCITLLNNNEVVALVGDRDFTEKGDVSIFFGRQAILPRGPAALSIKTGAAIVPGFVIRNNDESLTLRFEKPIQRQPEDSIPELTRRCTEIIEEYIRRYPDQWYMFRRFWIS